MFEFCRIDISQNPCKLTDRTQLRDEVELQIYSKYSFACFRSTTDDAEPLPIPNCKENWHCIIDPIDDRKWWFLATHHPKTNRLITELYRSVGVVETKWSNGAILKIRVECADLPDNAVQATLDEFIDDLIAIIISKNNPLEYSIKSEGRGNLKLHKQDCAHFWELASLLEKLLKEPSTKLVVDNSPMATHKLKPTPNNLRRRLRRPDASVLWGEHITEHLDTGENRFMHATAIRALQIINAAIKIEIISEDSSESYLSSLHELRKKFTSVIRLFKNKHIGSNRRHYNRVIMQRNRRYAKIYNLQKDLFTNMVEWSEIGELLAQTRKIRVTHLAQIYERWCLLKIIRTLIDCYHFIPKENWLDVFVRDIMRDKHNIDVRLHHENYGYDIILSYEHELDPNPLDDKVYRPDFVIQLDGIDYPKLVLDAKLRTRLGRERAGELHHCLHTEKNYSENDRNLVFVIQPANPAVTHYDCLNWTGGWIYALAGQGRNIGVRDNIRLAILQWLQYVEYIYTTDTEFIHHHPNQFGFKICPNCGSSGNKLKESQTSMATRKMTCLCCQQIRLWTHCFNCHQRPLIKNPGLNYFKTNGSECNVVCPNCNHSFERSPSQSFGAYSPRRAKMFTDDDIPF